MTLVKVCGMTRADDVEHAVRHGADMIGFVLVPWSPRGIDLATVRALRGHVPADVEAIGVLAGETAEHAAHVLAEARLDRVQVYGPHAGATAALLGDRALVACRLPDDDPESADPVVLDRRFDDAPDPDALAAHWALAAQLADQGRRVMLAGALTPSNVSAAITAARPWAVDVARGVEASHGAKDHDKLSAFLAAAREGARA